MTEPLRPEPPELPPALAPPVPVTVEEPEQVDEIYRHGLEVQARSQWELMLRRFIRHKLAVGALVVFLGICALSTFSHQFGVYDYQAPDPLGGQANPNYPV